MAMSIGSVGSVPASLASAKTGDAVAVSVLKKTLDIQQQTALQLLQATVLFLRGPAGVRSGSDVRAQAGCSAPAYCQCGRHWCCRECCGGASDGGMCRPLSHLLPCLQAQHLVAAEVPLRRTTTSNTAPRALMTFRGCPRPLGATIVLRGSDAAGKSLPGCLGSCCPCLPCPAHAGVGGLCRRGTHPQRCCSVPPQSSGR